MMEAASAHDDEELRALKAAVLFPLLSRQVRHAVTGYPV